MSASPGHDLRNPGSCGEKPDARVIAAIAPRALLRAPCGDPVAAAGPGHRQRRNGDDVDGPDHRFAWIVWPLRGYAGRSSLASGGDWNSPRQIHFLSQGPACVYWWGSGARGGATDAHCSAATHAASAARGPELSQWKAAAGVSPGLTACGCGPARADRSGAGDKLAGYLEAARERVAQLAGMFGLIARPVSARPGG